MSCHRSFGSLAPPVRLSEVVAFLDASLAEARTRYTTSSDKARRKSLDLWLCHIKFLQHIVAYRARRLGDVEQTERAFDRAAACGLRPAPDRAEVQHLHRHHAGLAIPGAGIDRACRARASSQGAGVETSPQEQSIPGCDTGMPLGRNKCWTAETKSGIISDNPGPEEIDNELARLCHG